MIVEVNIESVEEVTRKADEISVGTTFVARLEGEAVPILWMKVADHTGENALNTHAFVRLTSTPRANYLARLVPYAKFEGFRIVRTTIQCETVRPGV